MDEWRWETLKMATRKRGEAPRRDTVVLSDYFTVDGSMCKPGSVSSEGTEAVLIQPATGHGQGRRA